MHPIAYSSAEAFLEDAKHPKFDCLVLDIQLKGMSGLELARELAAKGDSTPFIFITAHEEPAVRAEAEALGCVAYYRKTASGADVLSAIRRVAGIEDAEAGGKDDKP